MKRGRCTSSSSLCQHSMQDAQTESANPKSRRGAGTREGHEYKLRKDYRSSRRSGHYTRNLREVLLYEAGRMSRLSGWICQRSMGDKDKCDIASSIDARRQRAISVHSSTYEMRSPGLRRRAANRASRAAPPRGRNMQRGVYCLDANM